LADEKILSSSQVADLFQQPGTNPGLGKAPNLTDFIKQTGLKTSSLNDFLKTLEGQISIQTERSAAETLKNTI